MIRSFEQLTDAFAEAAQSHLGIESFDAGDTAYFFNPDRDVEYPHAYLRYNNLGQAGTRSTLNVEIVVLQEPASEIVYGLEDYTDTNGVVLTPAFSWNRNEITAVDTARDVAQELITLVKRGSQQGKITIGDTYTGNNAGSKTSSAKGWAIPVAVSYENPFDITQIPQQ